MAIEGLITIERALRSLRETIGQAPGYVYNPPEANKLCRYASYDEETGEAIAAGCAVGQALFHEGLELNILVRLDSGEGGSVDDLYSYASHIPITPAAASVYAAAQNSQDQGATWGEALAAAEQRAKALSELCPDEYSGDYFDA